MPHRDQLYTYKRTSEFNFVRNYKSSPDFPSELRHFQINFGGGCDVEAHFNFAHKGVSLLRRKVSTAHRIVNPNASCTAPVAG